MQHFKGSVQSREPAHYCLFIAIRFRDQSQEQMALTSQRDFPTTFYYSQINSAHLEIEAWIFTNLT